MATDDLEQPDAWHTLDADEVSRRLGSGRDGLDAAEAARRLAADGSNEMTRTRTRGPLRRLLDQFHNILIYILIVAAVFTALMEHWVDTFVIAGVVVINAVIGFIQEGKAERAMEAIRDLIAPRCVVVRGGQREEIDARELVRGDRVLLESGDRVPADLRLVEARNLQVDESALTGESVPVTKGTGTVAADSPLGDRTCITYAGTMIATGRAAGMVVATADATEVGRIGRMLGSVETLKTPLLVQIQRFGHALSATIVALAALTFGVGVLVYGSAMQDMFLAAVSLAVAAIPEGLPAIITITLALGVQAMARRNAIVRRLPAVEALGSVTVICSDKTGTLTKNEMTLARIETPGGCWDVEGSGYTAEGGIHADGAADADALEAFLRCGVLCNDTGIELEPEPKVQGDPTEAALKVAAHKHGLDPDALARDWPRVDAHPFESEMRYMATLHERPEGGHTLFIKGAPEVVFGLCGGLEGSGWHERLDALAARGMRVLALAVRDAEPGALEAGDPGGGFTLLGLAGLIDPPRPEAIEAVRECLDAGITVTMITGDHAATACAVARELGIAGEDDRVVEGKGIDQLDASTACATRVFARVSPAHKMKLVELLQAQGQVVAMTGDGVNDAPALRRANVGVAMGRKGTEAAREASEIVLADDNFATIAAAVAEGRRIYDNIRKAILFVLPTNAGQALTILVAVVAGYALPITPVQVLWVNMVTAVTLALALIFEPAEHDVMRRPPRAPGTPVLSPILVHRTLFVGVLMLAATFGLFAFERAQGATLETARTVAVNALVMCEVFYLLACRWLDGAVTPANALRGNPWIGRAIAAVLLLQLAFTYTSPMQRTFGTAPLDEAAWMRIIAAGVLVLVAVEIEKAIRRYRP